MDGHKFVNENYEHTTNVSKFGSMTTLTVEIDKERDLPELEAVFDRMGLKFRLNEDTGDNDDWADLSDAEVEGIKAGIDDFKNGRVVSHAEAMAQIEDHIRKRKVGA
jgi:predicted transcriptional regulator